MKEEGAVPSASTMAVSVEDPRFSAFRVWLKQHCGTTGRWLPALGPDPAAYDAMMIRNVILNQAPSRSQSSVRLTAACCEVTSVSWRYGKNAVPSFIMQFRRSRDRA
jgi:hypothetical protein